MIDLEYVVERFNEYIQNYDLTNERIKLKIAHMLRVMDINIQIAKMKKLSEEDIRLAGIIGLFHDVGRFYQVKQFNTFIDKDSINHGIAGIKLLFEDSLIEYFVKDKKYYNIIKFAIENHNKYEIEEMSNDMYSSDEEYEKIILHSKLIRDADKIDIYNVMLMENPYVSI